MLYEVIKTNFEPFKLVFPLRKNFLHGLHANRNDDETNRFWNDEMDVDERAGR